MTDSRLILHNNLCEILSCSYSGSECRVYFQPPSSVKMKYPAIVYVLDDIDNAFANDRVYLSLRKYLATLIVDNPDSILIEKLSKLRGCRFSRQYIKDNLNHYVFEVFI